MSDELTPREHAEMKDLVLAGAQRVRTARSRRAAMAGGVLALVLVAGISGGAIATATHLNSKNTIASPSPTATATPTSTPTPAPTVTPTPMPATDPAAIVAFDGDCASVLTGAEVSEAVGLPMATLAAPWSPGDTARLGGVHCSWTTSEQYTGASVVVAAYPAGIADVVGDDPQLNGCEEQDAWTSCATTTTVGDMWISVSVGTFHAAVEPADAGRAELAMQRLSSLVVERAAGAVPPRPAIRGADWWVGTDCEVVFADLASAGYISTDTRAKEWSGRAFPLTSIVDLNGLRSSCSPDYVEGSIATDFTLWPGGGESFAAVAALDTSTPVEVPGALAAVVAPSLDALEGHYPELVVTDGDNMLRVGIYTMTGIPEESDIEFAAALLAVLANY